MKKITYFGLAFILSCISAPTNPMTVSGTSISTEGVSLIRSQLGHLYDAYFSDSASLTRYRDTQDKDHINRIRRSIDWSNESINTILGENPQLRNRMDGLYTERKLRFENLAKLQAACATEVPNSRVHTATKIAIGSLEAKINSINQEINTLLSNLSTAQPNSSTESASSSSQPKPEVSTPRADQRFAESEATYATKEPKSIDEMGITELDEALTKAIENKVDLRKRGFRIDSPEFKAAEAKIRSLKNLIVEIRERGQKEQLQLKELELERLAKDPNTASWISMKDTLQKIGLIKHLDRVNSYVSELAQYREEYKTIRLKVVYLSNIISRLISLLTDVYPKATESINYIKTCTTDFPSLQEYFAQVLPENESIINYAEFNSRLINEITQAFDTLMEEIRRLCLSNNPSTPTPPSYELTVRGDQPKPEVPEVSDMKKRDRDMQTLHRLLEEENAQASIIKQAAIAQQASATQRSITPPRHQRLRR